jgi:hypothetical protein
MSNPVWFRSLYWRIALGFVALLAVLLAAQGLVFLWLTGRVAAAWPGRSATELASSIASDLGRELSVHPELDINEYVNSHFSSAFRSFVVVMRDGRVVFSRRVVPPPFLERAAWTKLFGEPTPAGFGWRGPGFGRQPPGRAGPRTP